MGFLIILNLSKAAIQNLDSYFISPEVLLMEVYERVLENLQKENATSVLRHANESFVISGHNTKILLQQHITKCSDIIDQIKINPHYGIIAPISNYTGKTKEDLNLAASANQFRIFRLDFPKFENAIFFELSSDENTNNGHKSKWPDFGYQILVSTISNVISSIILELLKMTK